MATRGSTATYQCKHCGKDFTARVADRRRGWALFDTKKCKALEQEKRTGQWAALQRPQAVAHTPYRSFTAIDKILAAKNGFSIQMMEPQEVGPEGNYYEDDF